MLGARSGSAAGSDLGFANGRLAGRASRAADRECGTGSSGGGVSLADPPQAAVMAPAKARVTSKVVGLFGVINTGLRHQDG